MRYATSAIAKVDSRRCFSASSRATRSASSSNDDPADASRRCIELPNCAPAVKGKAAIEERYREFFGGPVKVTGFTFTHMEAVTAGELAYDVGTYEQTLSLPGGQTTTDHGKFVALVKRAQGTWKLAYLIYNTDTDPAKTR
jgi:ketosteroid isomerase-like protein